jgi:hypothetical protein
MASIMMTTALISSIVGQEAISEVSKSIFKSIKGIFYHTNPLVRELLEDIDIYNEIELVKTLIQEININTINNSNLNLDFSEILINDTYHVIDTDEIESTENTSNILGYNDTLCNDNVFDTYKPFISLTLTKCLYQLRDILEKIYIEINQLNKGVEYHKSLWFQTFRQPAYIKNLTKIKKYKKNMENKFEHLIKFMNIYVKSDHITN